MKKISTNAVKAIIKNKNNEILFLQRNPKRAGIDNWDFPGGLIEEGENEEDALVRECLEELDVKIEVIEKSGKWKFFRDFDNQWIDVQNYICKIISGEIKLSEEHIDYNWVKPEDIRKYEVKDKSLFDVLI